MSDPPPWVPILLGMLLGASIFAAGMLFGHYVMRLSP
jgi:hypothetical protein